MRANPDAYENNRVAFVTFNYEQSLEYFLFNAIKNSYGLNDDDTAKLVNVTPVIHLHGQLGLPYWEQTSDYRRSLRFKACMTEVQFG